MKYERKFIYLCLILIICFTGCKNNAQQVTLTTEQTTQQIQSNESTTIQQEESTTSEINYEDLSIEELQELSRKGDAEAQYQLGRVYARGEKIEQDYQKAFELFTKAAEQGNIYAWRNLGLMYFNGNGVQQDYQKAFEWYSKSAEQGDKGSQNNLGVMYLYGDGVQQDYKKAYEWFTKAAEQGDAYAQYGLGLMYFNGYGVQQDYQKAFEWYTKAAEQGDEEAEKLMAKIDSEVGTDFASEPTTKAKLIGTKEEVKEDMKSRLPKEYQSDKNFLCEAYMANEEKNLFDIDIQLEIGTDSIDDAKKIFYELLDSVSETEYNIEMYSFTFLNNGKSIGIMMAEVGSDTYTLLKNGKLTDFTR